jgi:hypothetical protein
VARHNAAARHARTAIARCEQPVAWSYALLAPDERGDPQCNDLAGLSHSLQVELDDVAESLGVGTARVSCTSRSRPSARTRARRAKLHPVAAPRVEYRGDGDPVWPRTGEARSIPSHAPVDLAMAAEWAANRILEVF